MANRVPDGTVTVVFTDVVGSTELTNRLGDQEARAQFRAVEETVREQVQRHRGVEVKGTGDGQMIAFTSARRAVLCAIDIQRALYRSRSEVGVRIGLTTGEVIEEDADLFGSTVNLAARVADQALAGDVLLSESTRLLLGAGSNIELVERGTVELKGFEGEWTLFAAPWEPDSSDAVERQPAGSPFVGRTRELESAREALSRAVGGVGQLLLLSGEPGIGKTRLAAEVMSDARADGAFVVTGHCYEMAGTPPFVPFSEALDYAVRVGDRKSLQETLGDGAAELARIAPRIRQVFPDLDAPEVLPSELARHYLFSCITDYLERATAVQPTVLLLDDLHWADESTALLLEHIAEAIHRWPMLLIGTYRDTDLEVGRPFVRTLDRLTRQPGVTRLPLRRFEAADVEALLGALGGRPPPPALTELIVAETEGVPFFVQEVYRYLAEQGRVLDAAGEWRSDIEIEEVEVPEGVRLTIGRRLERVSEGTRGVLTEAAVIGRRFSFELLVELSQLSEDSVLDAVEEAEAAQLIAASGRRDVTYSFFHEQIRQSLLGALPFPRRQRAHLRIANVLESASPDAATEIAYHLYQSGASAEVERTVHWLARAGDETRRAASFPEAIKHYRDAIELSEDPAQRGELMHRMAICVRATQGAESAMTVSEEAADLLHSAGEHERASRPELEIGRYLTELNRGQETADYSATVLSRGYELSALRRASFHLQKAIGFGVSDHTFEECEAEVQRAFELVGSEPAAVPLMAPLSNHFSMWEQHGRGREFQDQYMEAFRESANPTEVADTLRAGTRTRLMRGDLPAALAMHEEGTSLAARLGLNYYSGEFRAAAAALDVMRTGDVRALRAAATRNYEHADTWVPGWRSMFHVRDAMLAGDQAGVDAAFSDFEPSGLKWVDEPVFASKALADAVFGASASSAVAERAAKPPPKRNELTFMRAHALALDVQSLAMAGAEWDWRAAYDLATWSLESGLRIVDAWYTLALWERVAGIAAAMNGDEQLASVHFTNALRDSEEFSHSLERPESRRWFAWALLLAQARPDPARASVLLREATELYAANGMRQHARISDDLIRGVAGFRERLQDDR